MIKIHVISPLHVPPPAQTHLCPTPDNITQYRADQLIKGVFINFILYHSTACIIKKASL